MSSFIHFVFLRGRKLDEAKFQTSTEVNQLLQKKRIVDHSRKGFILTAAGGRPTSVSVHFSIRSQQPFLIKRYSGKKAGDFRETPSHTHT